MPTEKQVSAAFDAWEDEAHKWRLREVPPYWLVEPVLTFAVDKATEPMEDVVAYYKYRDKQAAQYFIRDKIIRAILTAAENT